MLFINIPTKNFKIDFRMNSNFVISSEGLELGIGKGQIVR